MCIAGNIFEQSIEKANRYFIAPLKIFQRRDFAIAIQIHVVKNMRDLLLTQAKRVAHAIRLKYVAIQRLIVAVVHGQIQQFLVQIHALLQTLQFLVVIVGLIAMHMCRRRHSFNHCHRRRRRRGRRACKKRFLFHGRRLLCDRRVHRDGSALNQRLRLFIVNVGNLCRQNAVHFIHRDLGLPFEVLKHGNVAVAIHIDIVKHDTRNIARNSDITANEKLKQLVRLNLVVLVLNVNVGQLQLLGHDIHNLARHFLPFRIAQLFAFLVVVVVVHHHCGRDCAWNWRR
mmetsp:Transcript_24911/g.40342  ORF Transcript_24911/g.40342 Transcript_24911/m.40342 type:complete len:285 (-) Transcript_24911:1003-1857(-)